jgi:hypothetical protein
MKYFLMTAVLFSMQSMKNYLYFTLYPMSQYLTPRNFSYGAKSAVPYIGVLVR